MATLINIVLNTIFPPKCIFCQEFLAPTCNIEICEHCYKDIPFIPQKSFINSISKYFDHVYCPCRYTGKIKTSLINYKFFEKSSNYRALAKLLAENIKSSSPSSHPSASMPLSQNQEKEDKINTRGSKQIDYDIIIPVPLHKNKEQLRGYNQSYLLAKALGKELHISVRRDILVKIKDSKSQSLLNKKERLENIKDAFSVRIPSGIRGKKIIIVDDILTTGSTLDECSRILKEAGASFIAVAVVASGNPALTGAAYEEK